MGVDIREERADEAAAIGSVTEAAFATARHSDGNEAAVVAGLRAAGALTVSMVAEEHGEIIGHAAFSPVRIDGAAGDWFGLGPVSVRPDRQSEGIGARIIRDGLERLAALGARGCVVFGNPAYYGRFGFVADPALAYAGAPPGFFQRIVIAGPAPTGDVSYHPAFDAPA